MCREFGSLKECVIPFIFNPCDNRLGYVKMVIWSVYLSLVCLSDCSKNVCLITICKIGQCHKSRLC